MLEKEICQASRGGGGPKRKHDGQKYFSLRCNFFEKVFFFGAAKKKKLKLASFPVLAIPGQSWLKLKCGQSYEQLNKPGAIVGQLHRTRFIAKRQPLEFGLFLLPSALYWLLCVL